MMYYSSMVDMRTSKKFSLWKVFLAIGILFLVFIAFKFFDIQTQLRNILVWISGLGTLAPIFFTLIYILACVLFIPGSILTLEAGVVFGVAKGSFLVSVASTLGATTAFLVGRYLAREWVARKIEGYPAFKAVDEVVSKKGWKIVGLIRLSPIFPFNLVNYAFGVTKVSLRDYFFASWVGMLPGTILYVYIGSLIGDLALLGRSGRVRTTGEWILYGIGFLTTVVATAYVTRLARKALQKQLSQQTPTIKEQA